MIVVTPYNTEFFEDMDSLMEKLYTIDYSVKQRRDEFFYLHQIWGNELGFYLTINIHRKSIFPPLILN